MHTPTSTPRRSAILFGLAFGASSMAACDKPESGSLENAKTRKDAPAAPAPIDYSKLDYSKIDYSKIDYAKIDSTRVKLDQAALTKLAESNVKLVSSPALADEVLRRLNESRVAAVGAKNDKLIADIDSIIKAVELNKSLLGDVMCW